MNISIIGAGKVGCALAFGFYNNGFNIAGVFSRSVESHNYLCTKLGKNFDNNLVEAVRSSDVIFISVSDNDIEKVAEDIALKVRPQDIRSKIFLHLSGALTTGALNSLSKLGAFTGSLHPVQTFADKENGWKCLYNIYYGFEGCEKARECAQDIIKTFNGSIIYIKKEDKPLYHAAACIISNYTVTLSYMAGEILAQIGLDRETASRAFLPLIKNTVSNLDIHGSVNALTGPISRGDHKVLEEHLKSLSTLDPKICEVYKDLGLMTIEVALKKGTLVRENAEKLNKLLKECH
ncbi:MAG: Rossmann-like and DUF2520 domain-containing protein [Bacillota bacterium]